MPDATQWNELVPPANRLLSPNQGQRPAGTRPSHIVVHVTGTGTFQETRNTFLRPNSTSAHYVIDKDGTLYQFVVDGGRAYHAGIDRRVRSLYDRQPRVWPQYLRYFSWYRGYPDDAVYVDQDLQIAPSEAERVFVRRADSAPWPHYTYFQQRWPGRDLPVNYPQQPDPNNYAIGIETQGYGGTSADAYTDAMYVQLDRLLDNLSQKYAIPRTKGRVVGHEDVDPVNRFGWDPSSGFDWSRVHR